MKIAIVTFEFEGLTKNGGIGTAFRRLSEVLRKDGHQVSLIFLPFDWTRKLAANRKEIANEMKVLKSQRIKVTMPEYQTSYALVANDGYHHRRSLMVYEYLKRNSFDVVHAADNCGLVYHSLLAKKAGLAFAKTQFVMGLHGAPFWTAEANGLFSEHTISLSSLDRISIELSDVAVSPSRYMLNYLKTRGWKTPAKTLFIPNANQLQSWKPTRKVTSRPSRKRATMQPRKSLVFFGRLERRKGIFLFLDAIHLVLDRHPEISSGNPLNLTFLGSEGRAGGDRQLSTLIRDQMTGHGDRVKLNFIVDYSSSKSIEFLKSDPNHLVCMPSLIDNSPYVIVEAIEAELDFIAATNGGQSELMRPQDAKRVLCDPKLESLVAMLEKRLFDAPIRVLPAKAALEANKAWSRLHSKIPRLARAAKARSLPKVSIVIGAHRRAPLKEITQSLRSAFSQKYPRLEIVIAKDLKALAVKTRGSSKAQLKTFDARSIDPRAVSLQACTGQLVLFLDGGTLLGPESLVDWVQSSMRLAAVRQENYGVFHGIVTRSYQGPAGIVNEVTIASADPMTHAMTGAKVGSSFALWKREALLEVSREIEMDFSSDTAARATYSHLLADGYKIASVPLLVVAWSSSRYEPYVQGLEHVSALAPFWKEDPQSAAVYAHLAGLYQDLVDARNDRYRMSERIRALEEMKTKIIGLTQ